MSYSRSVRPSGSEEARPVSNEVKKPCGSRIARSREPAAAPAARAAASAPATSGRLERPSPAASERPEAATPAPRTPRAPALRNPRRERPLVPRQREARRSEKERSSPIGFLSRGDEHAARHLDPDVPLVLGHEKPERAVVGRLLEHLDLDVGQEPDAPEVLQVAGILIADPPDHDAPARLGLGERGPSVRGHASLLRGNRIPVRIVGRVAERAVDPVLELLGDD